MGYSYSFDPASPANYTKGRGGKRITTIVIHHWDDPAKNPQLSGVVATFKNPDRKASAHYVVEAGRVVQMVDLANTAWHAGNWPVNQASIGIECNPRCSEADKTTIGELIRDLQAKYGPLKIIGHKDASSTACPGRYYPPASILAPYIGSGGGSAPAPTPAVSGDVDELARRVIAGEFGNGEERKARLGHLYDAVQARVNAKLGQAPAAAPGPNLEAMADAVIRGEYGNGAERRNRLGHLYDAVQAIVNRKLGY